MTDLHRPHQQETLAPSRSALAIFARFLLLNVAGGAARPATTKTYLAEARAWAAHCAERGVRVEDAAMDDVLIYRAQLLAHGYAHRTVVLKLGVVRRLYSALQAAGVRPDHPATAVRPPRAATPQHVEVAGKYLELGVLRALFNPDAHRDVRVAHLLAARDAAMIALMALQGLRVGEVAGLRLGDLTGDTLRFSGKGGKVREAYLIPGSRDRLGAWLKLRPACQAPALFTALDRARFGQPLSARSIRQVVKDRLAREGVVRPGVSAHSLRHSFATHALSRGARLEEIRDALGHASVSTTEVYAKVINARETSAARVLNGILEDV